jgi:serine/threonine protein kinase
MGSLFYVAPEILDRTLYHGTKVDVWSMGVCLFALIYSEFPFKIPKSSCHPGAGGSESFPLLVYRNNMNANIDFSYDIPISAQCKDLLSQMLTVKYANRISSEQLLLHPWLVSMKIQ